MNRILTWGLVCVLSIGLAGCGKKEKSTDKGTGGPRVEFKSHEDVLAARLTTMEDVVNILGNIKTNEDLQEANEQLSAIVEDLNEQATKFKELGEPTQEQVAKLNKLYWTKKKEITDKLSAITVQLAKMKGGKQLLKKLESIKDPM